MKKEVMILTFALLLSFSILSDNAHAYHISCNSCEDCSSLIRSTTGDHTIYLSSSLSVAQQRCIDVSGTFDATLHCNGNTIRNTGSWIFYVAGSGQSNTKLTIKQCNLDGNALYSNNARVNFVGNNMFGSTSVYSILSDNSYIRLDQNTFQSSGWNFGRFAGATGNLYMYDNTITSGATILAGSSFDIGRNIINGEGTGIWAQRGTGTISDNIEICTTGTNVKVDSTAIVSGSSNRFSTHEGYAPGRSWYCPFSDTQNPNSGTVSLTPRTTEIVVSTSFSDPSPSSGPSSNPYEFMVDGSPQGFSSSNSFTHYVTAGTRHCYSARYQDYSGNIGSWGSENCAYSKPRAPGISISTISENNMGVSIDTNLNGPDVEYEVILSGASSDYSEWSTSTYREFYNLLPNRQYTVQVNARAGSQTTSGGTVSRHTWANPITGLNITVGNTINAPDISIDPNETIGDPFGFLERKINYVIGLVDGTINNTLKTINNTLQPDDIIPKEFVNVIVIDNTKNPNDLENYQISVIVDTKSLIREGNMRDDCGDIRFLDTDRITNLNYWIENGCNTKSTKIWVNVPEIPALSVKTIYLRYGNPDDISQSNGDRTFEFFDDFENGLSKWIATDNYVRTENGELVLSDGNAYAALYREINPEDTAIEFNWRVPDVPSQWKQLYVMYHNERGGYNDERIGFAVDYGSVFSDYGFIETSRSYWYEAYKDYKIRLERYRGTEKVYINDSLILSTAYQVSEETGRLSLTAATNSNGHFIDNFFVRKYTFPEPSVSLIDVDSDDVVGMKDSRRSYYDFEDGSILPFETYREGAVLFGVPRPDDNEKRIDYGWYNVYSGGENGHAAYTQPYNSYENSNLILKEHVGINGTIKFSMMFDFFRNYLDVNPDFVAFYIDDVLVDRFTEDQLEWKTFEYPVTPGTHTFRWTYGRTSYGGYAYLDDVFVTSGSSIASDLSGDGDFEDGTIEPYQTGGDAIWTADRTTSNTGSFSAKSGTIHDGQYSSMYITKMYDTPGSVTFARKVSSESGYDNLEFYVDGIFYDSWSGEMDWGTVSYNIDAGEHTFEWIYSKDWSVSNGHDSAWVDTIVFE